MLMRRYTDIKLLMLLAAVLLQSCRCSHQRVGQGEMVVLDTIALTEIDSDEEEQLEDWSTLSDVGYPVIPDSFPSMLLERYCYSVSYNGRTRQPNWVMWQLDGDHVMKRKEGMWSDYRADTTLADSIRATLEDYAGSGYDRGHMCPGGDCNWDSIGRDETFVLSNMCPQHPELNRGDWKEIENACRRWARKYGTVYIVCGPMFFKNEKHKEIGPNHIPVPKAFFKVVVCANDSTPRGIGFICRNTEGNRKKDFYVNSIRQVERITGYKFFPNLSDSIRAAVCDNDSIGLW